MGVNMNGLRAEGTRNVNALAAWILENFEDLKRCVELDELVEVHEAIACSTGMHNCVYDKDDESYTDLSQNLKVIRLEVDDYGDVVESN